MAFLDVDFTVQSAAVDFLTLTSKNPGIVVNLTSGCSTMAKEIRGSEMLLRDWSFKGFEGWICGPIRLGHRADGWTIAMISGPAAHHFYQRHAPPEANCTRLDLQVTIRLKKPIEGLAGRLERRLWATQGDGGKQVSWRLTTSSDRGETLYVGSRHSQQMGRVYDKGVEAGIDVPGRVWRFEVEYKKPLSSSVWSSINAGFQNGASISRTVWEWFQERRIELPAFSDGAAIEIETAWKRTDLDTVLSWLHTQVRPTVLRLMDAGHKADLEKALQLRIMDLLISNNVSRETEEE